MTAQSLDEHALAHPLALIVAAGHHRGHGYGLLAHVGLGRETDHADRRDELEPDPARRDCDGHVACQVQQISHHPELGLKRLERRRAAHRPCVVDDVSIVLRQSGVLLGRKTELRLGRVGIVHLQLHAGGGGQPDASRGQHIYLPLVDGHVADRAV